MKLHGVLPVLEVPFTPDDAVDPASFAAIARHNFELGVNGVMFPAFASEYYKLTEAERGRLSDALIEVAADFPEAGVIASVPEHATAVAVPAAVRLVERGAGAINLLPPSLAGPPAGAVLAHCRAILRAVAPTPVIVQYAPLLTGAAWTPAMFAELRAEFPNLAAVKVESTPPGALIRALRNLDDPIPALVGYAGQQMVDAWRRGAVGVQPGCSFTELYLRVWQLLEAGREPEAVQLHSRLLPWVSYWMQSMELIIAAEKRISWRRGLIATPRCRQPAWTLDEVEVEQIEAFLTAFELG